MTDDEKLAWQMAATLAAGCLASENDPKMSLDVRSKEAGDRLKYLLRLCKEAVDQTVPHDNKSSSPKP